MADDTRARERLIEFLASESEGRDELFNWNDAGAQKLRAELMERLARSMLAASDTSPYPTALA
jgi:hypothetical protein